MKSAGDREPSMQGTSTIAAVDFVARAVEGVKLELMAEAYHILKSTIRVSHDEMRTIFSEWNRGELSDGLVAAAADALGLRDEDGDPLLEKVLDVARGPDLCREAASLALELAVPAPLISQAAFSVYLSCMKDDRVDASAVLNGPKSAPTGERHAMIEELRKALLASFILAYAEAFAILTAAGRRGDPVPKGPWEAFVEADSAVAALAAGARSRQGLVGSILLDARTKSALDPSLSSLRRVSSRCVEGGIHAPCLMAALSYYDGFRSTWLPSNMVVAIRDSREGSGYERVDRPRGEVFHSEWK
jgi:6-phosphogluconate dehydrogenase